MATFSYQGTRAGRRACVGVARRPGELRGYVSYAVFSVQGRAGKPLDWAVTV